MDRELRLYCTECYVSIGAGPLRPATVIFLNTLAAEHVCASGTPRSSAMTAEEIAALIDADKAKS